MTLCTKRRNKRQLKKQDKNWMAAKGMLSDMERRGNRATESQARSYRKVAKKAGMTQISIDRSLGDIKIGETRREWLRRDASQFVAAA